MHNRRPLRIASRMGPVETGILPALEAAYSRRSALAVEHDALGTGTALERAKRGGIDLVIAHAPARVVTAKPGPEIMVEGEPPLLDIFSALPVNPRRAADGD